MKKIVLLALLAMVTVCAVAQTKTTPKKVTVNQTTNAQKLVVYAPFSKGPITVNVRNGCSGCKKVVKKKPAQTGNTESQASINARLANTARLRIEAEYNRLRDSLNRATAWTAPQPTPGTWNANYFQNANLFQGPGNYNVRLSQSGWKRMGPGGRIATTVVGAAVITTGVLFIRNCIRNGCWKPDASAPAAGTTPPPSGGGPANVETVL